MSYTPWSIGIVGSSGSGKTTLIERLVPLLRDADLGVGVLKHARAGVEIDRPGKDSHRARQAGAVEVMLATGMQWALMGVPDRPAAEPELDDLLCRFSPDRIDMVLVEGFAHARHDKIEVYRPEHGRAPQCWPHDEQVIAVASTAEAIGTQVPHLDLDRPQVIADFIVNRFTRARRVATVSRGFAG